MKYRFIGDTNSGIGYGQGLTYDLDESFRSRPARVLGVLFGLPYEWEVIILKPIVCPYASKELFYENWNKL